MTIEREKSSRIIFTWLSRKLVGKIIELIIKFPSYFRLLPFFLVFFLLLTHFFLSSSTLLSIMYISFFYSYLLFWIQILNPPSSVGKNVTPDINIKNYVHWIYYLFLVQTIELTDWFSKIWISIRWIFRKFYIYWNVMVDKF